ncbi:MAG TPA: AIR synthase related protein, partial [bacterium]|nr:AIR synthase related protein [bacterium]
MPHTTPMKDDKIFLSHGAGGKQSRTLVEKIILKYFNDPLLVALPDSATFDILDSRKTFCFTTDSYVVNPVFFPGGDIGKLAVCGTVNDLAVCGAKPLFISCAMIIEEGFSINDFERILRSMATTARKVGVRIVTGDTKVVDRGK